MCRTEWVQALGVWGQTHTQQNQLSRKGRASLASIPMTEKQWLETEQALARYPAFAQQYSSPPPKTENWDIIGDIFQQMKNSITNERVLIRKFLCIVERILRRITADNGTFSPNSGLG